MALGSEGSHERNIVVYSPTGTLTSSPSLLALPPPNLPFELIEEILSRLPVKLLLQLRCACKSWNSLISDTKFRKKHLSHSTTHRLYCITYSSYYKSYPLDSIFTNFTTTDITHPNLPLSYPPDFVGSCNGILCHAAENSNYIHVRLWNPSIRKAKTLPPLQKPEKNTHIMMMYGFGYDPVIDNYKVVLHVFDDSSGHFVDNYRSKVHTLGTRYWKSISNFPIVFPVQRSGQCVSGTINWLASKDTEKNQCFILSIDLGNESYQEVLLPNYGEVDTYKLHLSVLKDCLCMFSGNDVWVMKEYGNKESWTKLFTISYLRDPCRSSYTVFKAIYIFEDDLVLLKFKTDWKPMFILYNCRNDTSKLIESGETPEACIDSLISPYF